MDKRLTRTWITQATTIVAASILLGSCATHNKATRGDVPKDIAKPGNSAPSNAAFIESTKERKFSCSFVEFDERGDYLEFKQHQHCWKSIRELALKDRILLVMYCHGWKNSSQSGDVLKFNSFLGRLANSQPVKDAELRVHGVFISWKGGVFKSTVKEKDVEEWTEDYFNSDSPIVDLKNQNPVPALTFVPDQLTYWNRKAAAENRVSGVPLSRSVFTFASVARKTKARKQKKPKENIVVLMGHSFGALMIEQSVAEASVGALVSELPWFQEGSKKALKQVLPFDLVLLLNSAAPSLYSKMLRDLASAHDSARGKGKPLFVSLTSTADSATGFLHPLANVGSALDPSMWGRAYKKQMFELPKDENVEPPVKQNEFYRRTPGHNKFLVSHRLVENKDSPLPESQQKWNDIFEENIMNSREGSDFRTSDRNGKKQTSWRIEPNYPIDYEGKKYAPLDSAYWIIKCNKDLIDSHGDIWNERAMQAYGAIFGITRALE